MNSLISEFGHKHFYKKGVESKLNKCMANSLDPDETGHYEPSHLDLHCLQKFSALLFMDERVKGLSTLY